MIHFLADPITTEGILAQIANTKFAFKPVKHTACNCIRSGRWLSG